MALDEARTVPGPFRDVPVRLYKPRERAGLPVFLYLHGGGFKLGNQDTNDRQMRELAHAWGGAVLSAAYVHAIGRAPGRERGCQYVYISVAAVCIKKKIQHR